MGEQMSGLDLQDEEFNELLRLQRMYRREADKCMKGGSYFAGCVMLGAALEGDLTAMCHCFASEIPPNLIPKKNGKPKPLLDWTLHQLLIVARSCNWLPSGLDLEDEWKRKQAQAGDYAVVLKDFRNLVHPARWIHDFHGRRVTKRRMEMCFEILEIAGDWLWAKLGRSLDADLREEGS